jgi:hypothetical protein
MKNLKNVTGAGFVFEIVLALVVVSTAALALHDSDQSKKDSGQSNINLTLVVSPRPTPSPSAAPKVPIIVPTTGWNTYTLKYEKIKFQYPSNWKLTDISGSVNNETDSKGQLIYTPGSDLVTLTSDDSLELSIVTATSVSADGLGTKVISSSPVELLGSNLYLDFVSNSSPYTSANAAYVSTSPTSFLDFPASKNITLGPGSNASASVTSGTPAPTDRISISYDSNLFPDAMYPVSHFEQDPNYKTLLQILASMTY